MRIPISITILAKNSRKYLAVVLTALQSFDEVIVYDTGSTDDTMEIAKKFPNVSLYSGPFIGFGPTHNEATRLAKHDWILSIDSDEVATPELIEEIKHLALNPKNVYTLPRHNFFNGKWIKWCGWHPERVPRLYNRKATSFSNNQVHEGIFTEGLKVQDLKNPLNHYPYSSITDFIAKMQLYSDLFAKQNQGKASSPGKAVSHGFFAFFKSYILKRGFMGGYEGFVISLYNGHTAYYKYLKLYEVNCKLSKMRRCPEEKGSSLNSSSESH